MTKILVVEDDVNLGLPLTGVLEMQDYKVSYLTRGEGVMEEFRRFKPDIVILDVILNGVLDGFEIAKLIRAEKNTPILFTTSREENEDFKTGFGIENTDYVRKPYRVMEVMVRLKSLLSKQEKDGKNSTAFRIGNFNFSPEEQSLQYECEKIHLNKHESAVLALLCKNRNMFVSKTKIIEQVWQQQDSKMKEGSLNNILTILRKYLKRDSRVVLETKINLGVKLMLAAENLES